MHDLVTRAGTNKTETEYKISKLGHGAGGDILRSNQPNKKK